MGGVGWGVQEAVAVLPTVVRVGLTEKLQLSKDLQEMEVSHRAHFTGGNEFRKERA